MAAGCALAAMAGFDLKVSLWRGESLSVIVQVWYYKLGKRKGVKQRIFKRTPIHDNFRVTPEQLDPDCKYLIKSPRSPKHESKITIRFWIITIILAALTIITLKIR